MDRKNLRELTHNAKTLLTVDNPVYKQWIFRYTFLELEKDLGKNGDITTKSIFTQKAQGKAEIVAKEDGIIAGLEEIKYFLVDSDPTFRRSISGNFRLNIHTQDGAKIEKNEKIMEISGEIHDLLAVERTILNLLMRMSGVATFTKKIVDIVSEYDILVTPTRKTLWGLLDKKAVTIGGGGTHRLNLSDSIIVKDTHLDLSGRNFSKIFENIAKNAPECRFVEIEVNTKEESLEACEKFLKSEIKTPGVIMFDNMPPSEISTALTELKNKNLYDNFLFEASGGITQENIISYAKTGIDVASLGALTASPQPVDMSLKILL